MNIKDLAICMKQANCKGCPLLRKCERLENDSNNTNELHQV